ACPGDSTGAAAVAAQQGINESGERERRTEGAYDGGASRQIPRKGSRQASSADERSSYPGHGELASQGICEHYANHRRYNQERKYQQHPGDGDRTRHDDAEARVEDEFPSERAVLFQPRLQDEVQQPNRNIERRYYDDVVNAAGEDVAGQNLLEVLGPL